MFDNWKLQDFAFGEGAAQKAFADNYNDNAWLDIDVPGDIHRTLIAEDRIEDPFYDQNEDKCAWMEEREWWYRCRFDGPAQEPGDDERFVLVFHGLDTFVTIWLNGTEIGTHQNMFREAVFDITEALCYGQENTLALCFDPPLQHIDGFDNTQQYWGRNVERVFMRKAQFGYGWDWGPRLPTIGVWRPVELRHERKATLKSVHFYTLEIEQDQALVAVKIDIERFATDVPLDIELNIAQQTQTLTLEPHQTQIRSYLQIDNPQLWWTHDLGEAHLYDLKVSLSHKDQLLATHRQQVGIRTLQLDQSPDTDEPGTRFFRFVLNGVPIFAKGADWIPCDSFVGAIPDAQYEKLLKAAVEVNMNMLRVWGGGIYEHDVFYRLCNQLGILVWQDFMFACAAYPEDNPDFVAEVKAEAIYQVQRLRSHPCLALWCGNNENQWIHENRFRTHEPVPGALYYHHILPQVVAEYDGQIPYWYGSPYGGNDHNSMNQGNRHNWDVWHGQFPRKFGEPGRHENTPESVSYLRYAEDSGRFISEFGMHAAPVYETLRRNIPPEQLYHHSPSMDHHNKDNPKNKGDNLMLSVTGLPDTLEDYIDFSMIAQAEGLKFGIEHYRRRKPHCSGTLIWQLNDCWPVLSWSLIDYYGFGKAAYYYARRFYAPLMASFKALEDGTIELWVVNDSLQPLKEELQVHLGSFTGDVLWENTLNVSISANASQCVYQWSANEIDAAPNHYLAVTSARLATNRHFFVPIKDLQRKPVAPQVSIEQIDDHHLDVHLKADSYAFFVHLIVPDEHTQFTDNYFDLLPSEERTISVSNTTRPLTTDMISWRYR